MNLAMNSDEYIWNNVQYSVPYKFRSDFGRLISIFPAINKPWIYFWVLSKVYMIKKGLDSVTYLYVLVLTW